MSNLILAIIAVFMLLLISFVLAYMAVKFQGHRKYTGGVAGWKPEELRGNDDRYSGTA